jgi:hypothetical protein
MGAEEFQTLHSFALIPLPEFRRTQKRNEIGHLLFERSLTSGDTRRVLADSTS